MMLLGKMMKYCFNAGLLLLILYTMRTSLLYTFYTTNDSCRGVSILVNKNNHQTTKDSFSAPCGGTGPQ